VDYNQQASAWWGRCMSSGSCLFFFLMCNGAKRWS
jgi:hypothetical protein